MPLQEAAADHLDPLGCGQCAPSLSPSQRPSVSSNLLIRFLQQRGGWQTGGCQPSTEGRALIVFRAAPTLQSSMRLSEHLTAQPSAGQELERVGYRGELFEGVGVGQSWWWGYPRVFLVYISTRRQALDTINYREPTRRAEVIAGLRLAMMSKPPAHAMPSLKEGGATWSACLPSPLGSCLMLHWQWVEGGVLGRV